MSKDKNFTSKPFALFAPLCSPNCGNEKTGADHINGRFSKITLLVNAATQHQPEPSHERHRPEIRPHAG